MDTSISGTALRLVGMLSDTAFRITLVVGACTLLVAVTLSHPDLLPPLLGAMGVIALLWRPLQRWVGRSESWATMDRLALERQVRLLVDQVECLQREQTQLRATVRWQEQLLERMVREDEQRAGVGRR